MANLDKPKYNAHLNANNFIDDNCNKPLKYGCEDNWTWSKKYRSQEVVLPEPTMKKGKSLLSFHEN